MTSRYLAFTALAATFSTLTSPRILLRKNGGTGGVLTSSFGLTMFSRGLACSEASVQSTTFIDAATAQAIDKELMSEEGGFRLEQLMELAGLSVASAAQVGQSITVSIPYL